MMGNKGSEHEPEPGRIDNRNEIEAGLAEVIQNMSPEARRYLLERTAGMPVLQSTFIKASLNHPNPKAELEAIRQSREQERIIAEAARREAEKFKLRDIPGAIVGLGILGGFLVYDQGVNLMKSASSLARNLKKDLRTIKH